MQDHLSNLEEEKLSQQAILQTRTTVAQNGGKFVLILMPTKEEVYRSITEVLMGQASVDAIATPRLRLLGFCQRQAMDCLDMLQMGSPIT